MRSRGILKGLEDCSSKCANASVWVLVVLIVIPVIGTGHYRWAFGIIVLGILFPLMTKAIFKCKNSVEWSPGPNRMNQPDQTPINSVSSSIPHATFTTRPPPPLHLPRPGQLTPPTPTTNDPQSLSSVSLSSQLNQASHASSFPSPFIAPQSLNRRDSNSSTWPSSLYSPSAPIHPVHNSPSNVAGYVDVEAARRHAANLQPPAYPEVVQDSPGLPPPLYTTLASDEASTKVFGSSSDGLPSYEVAVSTWQPPVDEEHPSRHDDGQRTND